MCCVSLLGVENRQTAELLRVCGWTRRSRRRRPSATRAPTRRGAMGRAAARSTPLRPAADTADGAQLGGCGGPRLGVAIGRECLPARLDTQIPRRRSEVCLTRTSFRFRCLPTSTRVPHDVFDFRMDVLRPSRGDDEARFVENLINRRRELGISQEELARRMTRLGHRMNQSVISKIESGSPPRNITIDEAFAFATALDETEPAHLLWEPHVPMSPEGRNALVRMLEREAEAERGKR